MSLRKVLLFVLILAAVALAWFAWRRAGPATPAAATRGAGTSSRPAATATAGAPADFAAQFDAARTLTDRGQRNREFGRLFRAWLDRDAAGAVAWLRQQPRDAAEFTPLLLMALDTLVRTDPDAALALAGELATNRDQRAGYSVIFAVLAQQDPAAAARRLARVPGGEARELALRAVAAAWARRNSTAALGWAEGLADDDREMAVESVLADLVHADPLRVIEVAQRSLHGEALARTLTAALHGLVRTDPVAASAIVPLLPAGEGQVVAAAAVARALVAKSPAEAVSWVNGLTNDTARRTAMARLLETWTATDAEAAGRHVASLPPAQQATDAPVVAGIMAAKNEQAALAWAQALSTAEAQGVALAAAANAWSQRDGAAASRWVADNAARLGERTPETLQAALSYWILQDAAAAQRFVGALAPALQAGAAEFVAPLLAQKNPTAALAWAQSLPSAEARDAAVAAAFVRWRRNAPTAADAWLAATPLPVETKARLAPPAR
ncbi:hypothetical protein [Opitutus sp. ER46]|uniref:hypothetical protein n=1 Tax=Opitutus sp. ER46 TaxID=2161864 RepID=UPI000D30E208|nr:hypothetical protein [Opitutus sp. ER46]PTX95702.1 hypothetical protein DB354_09830 [Opitutus sp. ER46]